MENCKWDENLWKLFQEWRIMGYLYSSFGQYYIIAIMHYTLDDAKWEMGSKISRNSEKKIFGLFEMLLYDSFSFSEL